MSTTWVETTSMDALRAQEMATEGLIFRFGNYIYRTVGQHIANGGMGAVYALQRRENGEGDIEEVVGKSFHSNYLFQIRTDEVTRRDHHANLAALARIMAIDHPNVLPTYLAAPIADNYLMVTPRMSMTLLEAVSKHNLSPRARVKLLMQALDGLSTLHSAHIIHRDFTLRNLLVDEQANIACVFDFDLAMSLDDLGIATYRNYYRGRIFGSPGWSVAPETVDQALMDTTISTALDVYAVGAALHGLFTDEMLYGQAGDMWALLIRIAEGVVVNGKSKVHYPDTVPTVLRTVIDGCLERDPAQRTSSVQAVYQKLRTVLRELPDESGRKNTGQVTSVEVTPRARRDSRRNISEHASDPSITPEVVEVAEHAIWTWGYQVSKSLGRVRNHPIFLATPREDQIASGQFPDANTFPKLVTVIDLTRMSDPRKFVENWQQYFWPILKKIRSGLLTNLHKVIYDAETSSLLLFSEYIDEPRFGDRISEADMNIDGALALGFLVIRQVASLHEQGMAHNNIQPSVLLFKGNASTRTVQPAMIGLVEPAMGAEAIAGDCRALAGMILTWLRPNRLAQLNPKVKSVFESLRTKLSGWAFDKAARAPSIEELAALMSDGLSLVDFNYSVLRDAGGDLQEYALLLLSLRTYHVLWPSVPKAAPPPVPLR
jgi:serine/threonine protein kinase